MGIRWLRSIAATSLCALAGLLALVTGTASAHLAHPYLCQITGSATPSSSECNLVGNTVPGGAFGEPAGTAIDGPGQVYVSDSAHKVVDVFDSAGNFTRQITGPSPGTAFNDPLSLAVDGSNDLWVSDLGRGVGQMDEFDPSGNLLAQGRGEGHWTGEYTESIAFSDASNRLYVADSYEDDLWVLNADGSFNSDIKGAWGEEGCCYIRVAADNSSGATKGDLYVSSDRRGVYRINGAGAPAEFAESGKVPYVSGSHLTGTPNGPFSRASWMTVDQAGDLYVVEEHNGPDGVVDEFNSAGRFLAQTSGTSTPDNTFGSINGVAVNGAGDMYLVDGKTSPSAVDEFGPLTELPSVAIEPASNVEAEGATFNGTVNPEEAGEVNCEFVWGTTTAYGHVTACPAAVPNGEGAVPVQVHPVLQANTTYHFRLLAKNANGTEDSADQTFTTPGPPLIDAESAEVAEHEKRGQTSATLRAQITPDKRETTYHFEYGETQSYGKNIPASPGSVGSGGGPVSVPAAAVTGLKLGTTYHYRVVAVNEYGTVDGPDQTFTTLPTLLIDSESATSVTATSATLEAQLNPLGTDTAYHFEYGTSASYGASLPAPDGDAGASESDVPVEVHLQGLQPHTTYHYRIVALNAPGGNPVTINGPDRTFTTQATATAFALPDGRQWEMVSPPNKQGAGIYADGFEQGSDIQASANGDGITFTATAPFVANPAGSRSLEVTQVISMRRAPESWETADIATAHNEREAAGPLIGQAAEYKLFSPDLSLGLVEPAGTWPLPPLPPEAEQTVYFREADGAYKALVTSANVPAGTKFGGEVRFVSASPDLSHVVIISSAPLVDGAPAGHELYEWAGGQLQLVSVLPNGEPVSEPGPSLGERGDEGEGITRNAISEDGSRVVWELHGKTVHYYVRDMVKKETVQIDAAQEGLAETTSGGERYMTASSTGSQVFFTSARRLTTDASANGEDLYAFEVTSGKDEPLAGKVTDLTPSAGEGANVVQVIGASEDGAYMYFVARGVLGDGGAKGAEPNGHNLYLVRYDESAKAWSSPLFIAALSTEDGPTWGNENDTNLREMTARVSPNGRYLAFMSDRSLTGYENRDANSNEPDEEVFLYDASTERLVCASCDPTGGRPVGLHVGTLFDERLVNYTKFLWQERWLAGNVPGWTTKDLGSAIYQSRYLDDSGRLFFDSADALVPADVNGREDVYEYEPVGEGSCRPPGYGQSASVVYSEQVDGCVGLISAGTSSEESAFLDASESGGDVFFLTEARLSPKDYDTALDVYDAHECTAVAPCASPAPSTPPPCTTGDACKPAPAAQPTLFGAPSSETFSGAGNVAPQSAETKTTPRSSTRTQKLAKVLRACRKKPRRKRPGCERRARKALAASRSQAGKSTTAATRR